MRTDVEALALIVVAGAQRHPLLKQQQNGVGAHTHPEGGEASGLDLNQQLANLARQQAHAFARRHGLAVEELLGPAYEGLCKGAIGFDPSRGHRPSSYLVPKVKGELLHYIRDTGFAVRISHRLRELWIRARRPVAQGLSDQQIAQQLGVPLPLWLECRRACGQRPVPLQEELLG